MLHSLGLFVGGPGTLFCLYKTITTGIAAWREYRRAKEYGLGDEWLERNL